MKPDHSNWMKSNTAFYTAVASNQSARELMQKKDLCELAVILTEKVRENASIDWNRKESIKTKLRSTIRRILRKDGYPPDQQEQATDTVLKQAEQSAAELRGVGRSQGDSHLSQFCSMERLRCDISLEQAYDNPTLAIFVFRELPKIPKGGLSLIQPDYARPRTALDTTV